MKLLLLAFLITVCGCGNDADVYKRSDAVIKGVTDRLNKESQRITDSVVNQFLETYVNYSKAKISQDSIQIEILRHGNTKKREKLFYYYDSIRVFYAKKGIKLQSKPPASDNKSKNK